MTLLDGTPTVPPPPTAKPSRFKWQESTRSLLLAMTILGVLLAWGRDRYAMQQEVQALKLEINERKNMLELAKNARIVQLEKQLVEARAWELPVNRGRSAIEELLKVGADVSTDATFIVLQPPANDEDVAKLKHLPKLEVVRLQGDQFTDRAVEHLRQLDSLRYAYVYGSPLTDRSVKILSQMPELEGIAITRANITDDSVAALTALPHLEKLVLDETPISDAALGHVAKLTKLRSPSLRSTNISDAAIRQLIQLSALERLYLRGTQITQRGVDQLKLALPDCLIVWE